MIKDFIGEGLTDSKYNKNVVNILRTLIEDKDCTVYIPYDYVVGRSNKQADPRVHFAPKESGKPVQVISITDHKTRFNFSLTCLVDVQVEFCDSWSDGPFPTGSSDVYLKPMKVWRTYTVVRDGKLNISQLVVKLSQDAFNQLRDAGNILFIDNCPVNSLTSYYPNTLYTLNLSDLSIVSSNWARPSALNFGSMLLHYQALAESIKKAKKELDLSSIQAESDNSIYTEHVTYNKSAVDSAERTYADAVEYTLIDDPTHVNAIVDAASYKAAVTLADTLRFKCNCIKWAMESATKKNGIDWGEEYQKKVGSSKWYSQALVEINGVSYRLQRCRSKIAI